MTLKRVAMFFGRWWPIVAVQVFLALLCVVIDDWAPLVGGVIGLLLLPVFRGGMWIGDRIKARSGDRSHG